MAKDVEVRGGRPVRVWDWFDLPDRWFEGMRPWFTGEDRLRIEQELTDDTMVIRAEVPGVDPDKDVEITVANGVLRMRVERRSEKKEEKAGWRAGVPLRLVRADDAGSRQRRARRRQGVLQGRHPRGAVPVEGPDDARGDAGARHQGMTARPVR